MRVTAFFGCRQICRENVVKHVVVMSCRVCYNGYSEKICRGQGKAPPTGGVFFVRGCKGVRFSMNTVEPIRDMDLVLDVADFLKSRNQRDYVLFMFGIYTGLRISDILKLRVRDVRGKDYVYIREKKTGKEKRFPINAELKPVIEGYTKEKRDYEYLFRSPNYPNKAISRQQAYNILTAAGKAFGISAIGTHTLRKTFGYHMYQQTHDAVTLKDIFNHSHLSETLRYIGINQDNKDKAILGLTFRKGSRR